MNGLLVDLGKGDLDDLGNMSDKCYQGDLFDLGEMRALGDSDI